jgi:hypothetical protein
MPLAWLIVDAGVLDHADRIAFRTFTLMFCAMAGRPREALRTMLPTKTNRYPGAIHTAVSKGGPAAVGDRHEWYQFGGHCLDVEADETLSRAIRVYDNRSGCSKIAARILAAAS